MGETVGEFGDDAGLIGGELAAGPQPGGGFAVRARLPLGGAVPPGEPS